MMAMIPDPINNLGMLAAVAFATNLCAAFQDVAVDGMAIDILPEEQRARANGFMFGGQALGIAFSTGVGGTMMSDYGFGPAISIISALLACIAVLPILFRERPGERMFPWSAGEASSSSLALQLDSWWDIIKSLSRAFVLPSSLIAVSLVFFYRAVEGMLWAVLPALTVQDLGWGDGEYSQVQASAGLFSGIVGMIAGATIIHRFGSKRILLVTCGSWILLNVLVASFPDQWANRSYATIYFFATNTIGMIFLVAVIPIFMTICWKKVAATQFSAYMAMANLGTSFGGFITGPLNASLDYQGIMYLVGALGVGLFILVRLIDLERHSQQIEALEAGENPAISS